MVLRAQSMTVPLAAASSATTTPVSSRSMGNTHRCVKLCRKATVQRMLSVRAARTSEAGVAPDSQSKHKQPTMFEKLGGKSAIEAVVDMFYGRVFADEEVSRFFEGINKQRLKAHQVEFMTYAFGGPEEYHGKDMWAAHEKLVRQQGLNDHHFDVIVKHLVGALQEAGVPKDDIKAAGEVVQTTRDPMFRDPKTQEYLG